MAEQIFVDPPDVDVPELEHLSDFELVALADSPDKEIEFQRRLALTPLANRLAFRFLTMWSRKHIRVLTVEEEAEFYDAFVGLRACCYKAKRNLYAPRAVGEIRVKATLFTGRYLATLRFLEDRILDLLAPYRTESESELQVLALLEKFKNLPREVYFDLLDRIKKHYAEKASMPALVPLGQANSVEDSRSRPENLGRRRPARVAIELMEIHKEEIVRQLGKDGWRTLLSAYLFALEDKVTSTRQERKGGLTRAIARTLKLELRQARHRKKSMQNKMWKALKEGDPVVSHIYEHLSEETGWG